MIFRLVVAIIFIFLLHEKAAANPSQFGTSGLLSVPIADTLDSANFCFGIWSNCSRNSDTGTAVIAPVTITLGIGTFWEIYGTYPNVFLTGDTQNSGRATTDFGTKIRFYGTRSSKTKVSVDLHMSRYIDDNPVFNGVTDFGGRLIASKRTDLLGYHFYGGYTSNGESRGVITGTKSVNEFPVGGGIDFSPSDRTKTTLELMVSDAASSNQPIEASLGFQYYLTPHLTFNLSYAMGLNAAAADWRVLFGLSTCQGVGAYIKPIPVVTKKGEKKVESEKPTKITPLSPLLLKTAPEALPESKFEVPVDAEGEEMLLRPYGTVVIPQQPAAAKPVTPASRTDQPDQRGGQAEEPVSTQPTIVPDAEGSGDYLITKVTGVTPLYGVRLKGPKVVTQTAKAPQGPVTAYRKFRLPDYLFEQDSVEMTPDVQRAVSELAEFIRKDKKWVYLRIDGHTDGVGSVKYNMDVSLKRAVSVANYLITREGIDPNRIFIRGMGKTAPIADNSTEEGRRLNRRFEIIFLVNKETR
jgi:outer membrane protein OmpA-like peptidoglycan-associated protein